MKAFKSLLVMASAVVLLGVGGACASAGVIRYSEKQGGNGFTRLDFRGGFGTVECEVRLEGSLHSSTMTKTVNSLIGYVTAGSVTRCARGSATVNRESLPWHCRYRGFTGALPNITGVSETIVGAEWTIREPTFGITCTIRAAESSTIGTYTVSGGTITQAAMSGRSRCGSFEGEVSGSTTNVGTPAGARITVTLI